MKKTSLIIICLASATAYSQSSRPKDIKDAPEIKERIVSNSQKPKPIISVSQYHDLESQISNLMISNKIPADCPTSINYPDRKKYIEILNNWLLENQDRVATENKNKLINEQ
jgi:hypothetical protein